MVAIPATFNFYHRQWLEDIEFRRTLIEANHPHAPADDTHEWNLIKAAEEARELELQLEAEQKHASKNKSMLPKRPVGRPVKHREFAHLTPAARNKAVQLKYQKAKRAADKAAKESSNV